MSNTKNYQQETGLLPAASLVSRTASQEKGERTKTSAIYGLNVGECCASYDQTRHCLKTCQDYLFQMKGGFSTEYYLTFTNAGMMRSGKLYPLHKSAHHICVKESGSFVTRNIVRQPHYWRTPDANIYRGKRSFENMKMRLEKRKPLNLNDQLNAINKELLPAPCAKKETRLLVGTPTTSSNKRSKKFVAGRTPTPAEFVKLFPTPKVQNTNAPCLHGNGGLDLQTAVLWDTPIANDAQGTQQLNPDWVEALMGYPRGWTDITKDTVIEVDYLEAWKDNSWEAGLPRVTGSKQNRINRLKCLGNAVVPEIPAIILQMVVRALW